jgi:uncharacterized protein YbaP (TraB family)
MRANALRAGLQPRVLPRTLALALVVLLLLGARATAAEPFAQGRLWQVSRPGVPDSFVLGTVHVADARVSAVSEPVARALDRARTLALEVMPGTLAAVHVEDFEQLDHGARLPALLPAAVYAKVREALFAQGMTEPAIERLKPWAAMLKVAHVDRDGHPRSLDENLYLAARERRMRVFALEAVAEQAAAFDMIPLASQVALLEHAIADRAALTRRVDGAVEAWLAGDLAAIARLAERAGDAFPGMAPHYAALARHLVRDRTAVMHHRLFLSLRAGRVFVAVGAAHIYGDDGLLALLERDGYRVTRLW